MTAVGGTPRGSMIAEDVRDLQQWPDHGQRSGRSWLSFLLRRLLLAAKLVERACNGRDPAGRHTGVARRGVKLVMSKQRLDQADSVSGRTLITTGDIFLGAISSPQ